MQRIDVINRVIITSERSYIVNPFVFLGFIVGFFIDRECQAKTLEV